ncbi:MAG TPA: alpha/beta hydrolase [Thermomonospora sp.]|nr:alpha/beta hydrolase [Thermomonospora sp.]
MRKVLVFGAAAVAAVSLSGVVTPDEARAEPGPGATSPVPGANGGRPGDGGQRPRPPRREAAGVTARAVMVTPPMPHVETYSYGDGERQRLDAYWRTRENGGVPGRRPGILILHGGYWMAGDKTGWRYAARRLTTRGYVVISANYRLAQSARWPSQREDVQAALEFVRRNADLWNLDPERIVVLGSSAGGHLATQLGTYGTGASGVRGVVALSPVVSPQRAYLDGGAAGADRARRKLRLAVRTLIGCDPAQDGARCLARLADASSAEHAGPGDAPMLLLHSAGEFVPVVHGNALAAALNAAGVPAEVRTVPGDAHGGALLHDQRVFESVVRWIDGVTQD